MFFFHFSVEYYIIALPFFPYHNQLLMERIKWLKNTSKSRVYIELVDYTSLQEKCANMGIKWSSIKIRYWAG